MILYYYDAGLDVVVAHFIQRHGITPGTSSNLKMGISSIGLMGGFNFALLYTLGN